ncbi:MAG: glycosyltransferase [Bacteroidota bacterium]
MFRTPSRVPEEVSASTSPSPPGLSPGRIPAPTKGQQRVLRSLVIIGLVQMIVFISWYIHPTHIGYLPLYLLLSFSLGFRLFRLLHEWYHYWSLSTPYRPPLRTPWKVDVVTTFCAGEPMDMLKESLLAIQAIQYPHETWLCDETNDPALRAFCQEHGIHHHYRGPNKQHAKAGNINHALPFMQGEIVAILDPDHVPKPQFLDRLLPYFEEERIGYVQSIQAYHNLGESLIARGAAEQTYHFYGPMMMSMNSYGTVQAIGANCVFRRAALDEIGGHAPGLAEDMHTAIQLQAKGWESVYHPEALTEGEVPANLSAYYQQQLKWSRGTLEILVKTWPRLFRKLSLRQAFHYASLPLHFAFCLVFLADLLIPILALLKAEVPLTASLTKLFLLAIPIMVTNLIIRQYVQRWVRNDAERGLHLLGGILYLGTWWVHLLGLVCTLLRIPIPYIPTPKRNRPQNAWGLSLPNAAVLILSLIAVLIGLRLDWSPYSFFMASFALVNAVILGLVIAMGQQRLGQKGWGKLKVPNPGNGISRLLRRSAWAITLALLVGMGSLLIWKQPSYPAQEAASFTQIPTSPAFYWGSYEEKAAIDSFPLANAASSGNLQGFSTDWLESFSFLSMNPGTERAFLIDWPGHIFSDSTAYTKFLAEIISGQWDRHLSKQAAYVQQHTHPVFLNFLPAPSRWLSPHDEALIQYQAAYAHAVEVFQQAGASPLVWTWEAGISGPGARFQPKEAQVLLSSLDHASSLDSNSSLPVLFKAKASTWAHSPLPPMPESVVMLGGISTAPASPGLPGIPTRFTPGNPSPDELAGSWLKKNLPRMQHTPTFTMDERQEIRPVRDNFPNLTLPIKGVVYNPGQTRQDGQVPLVRKQLIRDFQAIREMGANTIRRGKETVYAHNLLSQASAHQLQVFWDLELDLQPDFFHQASLREQQKKAVLAQVAELAAYPALVAWGLGDRAFEQLRQTISPDLLPYAERTLAMFIGDLAQHIQAIDSLRPVYSILETGWRLGPKLAQIQQHAGSLDALGLHQLAGKSAEGQAQLLRSFWADKPVFSSGFGPVHPQFLPASTQDDQGYWPEASPYEKAQAYQHGWEAAMQNSASWGGMAYCWRNRTDGTAIWYGLTDHAGHKTPAYHLLRQSWKQVSYPLPLPDLYLTAPWSLPDFAFYRLITPALARKDCQIQWQVRDPYGRIVPVDIQTGENHSHAYLFKVEQPHLRVYVSLTDAAGNLVQTSAPIW